MDEKVILLIEEIAEKTGKTNKEIEKLINEKVQKFSGLLTEQGAAFMIQKELGIKQNENINLKINDLQDGQKDIDIRGKVKIVFPQKEFEKNEKKGKLSSFILEDDTGEVRVTLWNDQVEQYNLTSGSEIEITSGIVSSFNEKKQLSLGFNGKIDILNKAIENFEKINNLKGGMKQVNVIGRILRKFPVKEFETNEKKGKLCNFQFGDETTLLRATAWNEKASEITKFNEGIVIEIKNAYTKSGMFGIELHLGYNTNISVSDRKLPSAVEMMKENIEKTTINNLVENKNVIINVKIKEIENKKLHFLICEKCSKKIEQTENGIICQNCGEVKGKLNPVLNITVEDDTGEIKAIIFGETGLNILGLNQEEFEKENETKSTEKLVTQLNEKLIGKEIEIFGYSKTNTYSSESEFRVKEIIN